MGAMTYCDRLITKFKFLVPGTVLIAGSTSSGKTHLVKEILFNKEKVIEKPVAKVIYHYRTWQPLYDELQERLPEISFRNEIHAEEEPEVAPINECIVVIFDDFAQEMLNNSAALYILSHFIVFSHHCRYITIMITQNLYMQSKHQRTLSLNSSYLCLFRNLSDSEQIRRLARQVYGKERAKDFMAIYNKIMIPGQRYKYCLLNLHPRSQIGQSVHVNVIPYDTIDIQELERIYIPKPTGSYI